MPTPRRPEDIILIPRRAFLERYWTYNGGEHVTVLGFSGSGKTQLLTDLLSVTAKPELPSLIMVMKPEDDTMARFSRAHGHRIVREWPMDNPTNRLMRWLSNEDPPGWILWPEPSHSLDPRDDEYIMAMRFIRAMHAAYWHKRRLKRRAPSGMIVVADEAVELGDLETPPPNPIKAREWVNAILSRGRSLKVGGWLGTQRPAGMSLKAYQAHHLFLAREDDKRNRERYGEIGGVDPNLIKETAARLKPFHFLYRRRDDGALCIVGP